MKLRMRTRGAQGIQSGRRTGTRVLAAAGMALATVATVGGCALPGADIKVPSPTLSASDSYNPNDPTPSETPTDEDTYSPEPENTEETFDPDGRNDVTGKDCDFSRSLGQFTYTVSITNPSSQNTYSYDMVVNWMKAKPADGKAWGVHQRSITVGPGDTETYTAKYSVNWGNNYGQFWYTCQITRAEKTKL
ncbi:hypothetical protein [Streptomyces gilvosporeus]|uniref:Ig-like domain-containing protein n=2 Tax=Streptomyces gilvosporeus TaxID=553510 RepID=A0A1V0TSA1_9ACTN|nr:hypothetical protein B1H19_18065 [Streptomyces gilvosporeus]